ncbi:MAG: hypothetical protein ACT4PT_13885 [Methanobacteriota archaeon]
MPQTDSKGGPAFEARPVFDWNNFELGVVTGTTSDARKGVQSLIVDLNDKAKTRMGQAERLEVPVGFVFGIRRDEVVLDRSVEELRRHELAPRP